MQKMSNWYPLVLFAAVIIAALSISCNRKPSEKTANGEGSAEGAVVRTELCTHHQLPVTDCFMCDPALRDPNRLWCREHNRYEDRCFICHPGLKDESRLWCSEHNLYEDECFFCHPELKKRQTPGEVEKAEGEGSGSAANTGLQCEEHGLLEKECGICHPELAETLQPGQGLKIRFESPESAVKAGVGFTKPLPGKQLSGLIFLCRVTYNQNRFARITPLAPGVVQRVLADVGDNVTKGQVLVEINSPEIARAKSEYLVALANEALQEATFKRKKDLLMEKITSQKDFEQTRTQYELAKNTTAAAYQQLLNYGFDSDEIERFAASRSTSSVLRILAPFSGTLINRDVVVGETVEPGSITFTLADLSFMWLELSIPEDRIALLTVGDSVETTFEVFPGVRIPGRLTWLAAGIDERTRMLKGRAVVSNPGNRLKHGMFGQVRILQERSLAGLYVPAESLHRFGPNRAGFVFTKVADDLFEVRRVDVGGRNGEHVEILAGLLPEDQVVTAHSFTVKSEFLKARLGAGCVDE